MEGTVLVVLINLINFTFRNKKAVCSRLDMGGSGELG